MARNRGVVLPRSEFNLTKLIPALLLALILLPTGGCGRPKMNVVVIVVDTLRKDHLALYGYDRENAPFISSVGAKGAVFNGLSTSSWTKPATASLFTGLHPLRHQTFGRTDALPNELTTLTEVLKGEGYRTIGVSANAHISERFGFQQGFDELRFIKNEGKDNHSDAAAVNRLVLPSVRTLRSPFFLYVHYVDPHYPYSPSTAWDGKALDSRLAGRRNLTFEQMLPSLDMKRDPQMLRDVIDLYDGEIRSVDAGIEALFRELEAAGQLDNTIIVITSDHGEEFEEHGLMSHGQTLYEEVTRVPMIFYAPGLVRAGKRQGTALLEDVMPTLLELLAIPAEKAKARGRPQEVDGVSLASVLRNELADVPERAVLLHLDYIEPVPTGGGIPRTALGLIEGGQKIIFTKNPFRKELFDLKADPGESSNLLLEPAEVSRTRQLIARLIETFNRIGQRPARRESAVVDDDTREALRALGYLSGPVRSELRAIPRRLESINVTRNGAFGWERLESNSCILLSELAADQNLREGWHYAEANGRWTMKNARFDIRAPDQGETRLKISGTSWNPEPVTITSFKDNDFLTRMTVGPGEFEMVMPVKARGNEAVMSFDLEVDRTFKPSDAGSGDVRNLGVFLQSVCMEPLEPARESRSELTER